jgi:hypothetical protein
VSRSFVWRPVTPMPPPSGSVGLDLWHLLRDRGGYSMDDGPESLRVGGGDVGYLLGARYATTSQELRKDIDEILAAMKKHGEIEITVEH